MLSSSDIGSHGVALAFSRRFIAPELRSRTFFSGREEAIMGVLKSVESAE